MNLNELQLKELENRTILPVTDLDRIPMGDMPGDKIQIDEEHLKKVEVIYKQLLKQLIPVLEKQPNQKAVISVFGGSGVGKSEIGSLLGYYFNELGLSSYILSGDNYPHRIPKYNDAERLRVFREYGFKGLVANKQYSEEINSVLKELQGKNQDYEFSLCETYPWLSVYQKQGKIGLSTYLGTENEIDFSQINQIIKEFKDGTPEIFLKRMGREETENWYDLVDLAKVNVLIIEWTHGNNQNLEGVDLAILLNSTPQETLEHRKSRNRDGNTDSGFTTMVLELEQGLIQSQAERAALIVLKSGEIVSYDQYCKLI